MVVTVKHQVCCYCGGCVSLCPQQALLLHETIVVVDRSRCSGCGLCEKMCPSGALVLQHA